jgi:FkbM family methyltransferase
MVRDLFQVEAKETHMHTAWIYGSKTVKVQSLGNSFCRGVLGYRARQAAAVEFFYERMDKYTEPNVIDIGAGTGAFTLLAALHPGASVVAFEPMPSAWDELSKNIILNNLQIRTHVFRTAIWSHRGVKVLAVPDSPIHHGLSTLAKVDDLFWDRPYHTIRIATRTLDEMMDPYDNVDLIKIDTSGAELQAVQGAKETISRCKPDIFVKFSPAFCDQFDYNRVEIADLLEALGMRTERKLVDWLWATWPTEYA